MMVVVHAPRDPSRYNACSNSAGRDCSSPRRRRGVIHIYIYMYVCVYILHIYFVYDSFGLVGIHVGSVVAIAIAVANYTCMHV